jgi:hypothetical protein
MFQMNYMTRCTFRYSLRGAFVFIACFAIVLGILGRSARLQKSAVAEIERRGGHVTYAHQIDSNGIGVPAASIPGPAWLRAIFGDHYFLRIAKISFEKATDDDLAALQDLPLGSVEHLLLVDSPMTDKGLKNISAATFPNLRRLRLDFTKISDDGLSRLTLPKLENLYLSNTSVSNQGIQHLSQLKALNFLDVTETKVDAIGIQELLKLMPNLKITPAD